MPRYRNTEIIQIDGIRCFKGTKYPIIPLSNDDMFIITDEGDRLDLLALQFYENKNLWWILSIANVNLPQNSLYISAGTQLRVPTDIQIIMANYSLLNNL